MNRGLAIQARTTPVAADLETRAAAHHHDDLRLWLRILTCTNLIEDEIRSRLRSEFNTTLPRFDLMAQLERQPEGLRMGELSKRMMVTGGNITLITDQLEREGLVERADDPDHRRAFRIRLTKAGERVFGEMAAVHEQWIVSLFAGLSAAEKRRWYNLLGRQKSFMNERSK